MLPLWAYHLPLTTRLITRYRLHATRVGQRNLELLQGIQFYIGRTDLPTKRIKLIEPHLIIVEKQAARTRSYPPSHPYQTPNCTFWRIYNDRLPVSCNLLRIICLYLRWHRCWWLTFGDDLLVLVTKFRCWRHLFKVDAWRLCKKIADWLL